MGDLDRVSGVARPFGALLTGVVLGLTACAVEEPDRQVAGDSQAPPAAGTQAVPVGGAAGPAAGTGAAPPAGSSAAPVAGSTGTGGGGDVGTAGSAASMQAGTTGGTVVTPGNADWAMIGYDAASTYWNRAETVLTKDNAATLTEIWSADLIANVYGAPLQIGDTIYASAPSVVRAYDASTGSMKWNAMVGSTASMSYAEGTLYVGRGSGEVTALSAADGSVLWTKAPDSQRADGSSSPVVAGDVVLIGGSNGGIELGGGSFRGYLSALDRMTGDVRWTMHTVPMDADGASIWSSPSADVAANRAYGSTGNNYGAPATDTSDAIIAFDLGSGEMVWKSQRTEGDTFSGFGGGGPDYDFGANPVLYETPVDGVMTQLVSAGAKSGSAHAVRRDDGTLVWTRSLGTGTANGSRGIFVNSTWSGKNMLFACNEGGPSTLYALDGATGDVVWMRPLPGLVWGRISVANGVGFVGTGETLEVFDVDTGASIKSIPSKGGTLAGTITIAHGRVAFGEGLSWNSGKRGKMLTVLAVQ